MTVRSGGKLIVSTVVAGLLGVALPSIAPVLGASLDQVRELADRERYRDARAAFDALPAQTRDGPVAKLLDGVLKVHEGSVVEAAEVFRDIVRSRPDRPEPRVNLALLDARRWGILETPGPLMTEISEGDGGLLEAWWRLHDLEVLLAVRMYRRSGTLDPSVPAAEGAGGPPGFSGFLLPSRNPDPHERPATGASEPGAESPPEGAQVAASREEAGSDAARFGIEPTDSAEAARMIAPADSAEAARLAPPAGPASLDAPLVAPGKIEPLPPRESAGRNEVGRTAAAFLRESANAVAPRLQNGGPGTARSDSARGDAAHGPAREQASHAPSWHALLKALAFAAGTMALLAALGGMVLGWRRRQPRDRALRRRLQRTAALLGGPPPATEDSRNDESIFRPIEGTSRLSGLWSRVEARYPLLRIREALPVASGAGFAGTAACWFSMWFLQVPAGWWTTPASLLAGAGAVWYSLVWLQSRREAEFINQFPEIVDQIVRLAGAGVPALEAVAVVAEDARDPIRPVLGNVRDGLLAGLDADSTLRTAAERVRLAEFTLFGAVIRLQRRAGGGLSTAFANLSHTLRERRKTALKAHASTAQSRLTLLVLVLMPVAVLIAQKFIAPESIELLFGTEQGVSLLRWGVGLIVVGILIARKISSRAVQ